LARLAQTDIEKEVKSGSILACSKYVAVLHAQLDQGKMDKCVGQIIVDRLNNDSSRIYALRGIEIVINSSANLDNVREVVLSAVIPLVKKTMSDVKKTTLQVLKAFVVRYQTEVSSSFEEIAQAGLYGISKDNL
jgi:cullin-associated NEDD8-dissociated protein 1